MTTVFARGAEATVTQNGETVVEKERVEKKYRHPTIDKQLRENRTNTEVRLLKKARKCVKTPAVMETGDASFEMEYIDGEPVKDRGFDEDVYTRLGEALACLHDHDVIHGDLTTSNMLLEDGDLVLIDFGLGFSSDRVEDKATDLRLLKQTLHASHPGFWEKAWEAVIDAYQDASQTGEETVERVREIAGRGRYTA
jgi:Kae1-associated kinase Bud32